jgi:mono/diheme cytochrome c family protein
MTRTLSPAVLLLLAPAALAGQPAKLEYNRDVRPILAENCFACHGPDSAARKAKLRLDRRDAAVEAGAIDPGKPDGSEAIARIFLPDSDKGVMPPVNSHKTLKPEQKEILKRWVAEGAEYQPHWAFIPPVRPAVPEVKTPGWARNPIDRFVLAELEKRGLSPAPEADRRTLARRLSLDLVGLPPDPADVEEFVRDRSPDYYERYVDKLLASPHWGEHRGRYWLDAARYADTHGIHFDNYREIWAYRDWVISAFNRNLPFDQFTVEQLAGDLLPNPTLEQRIATGFNRCNITTNEGGVIPEEYAVLYTRDRTETVSQVWMGLTTGCAVCHDHKFDPLTQKEFYSLAAFFNNTTQAVMDGNVPNTPPVLPVPRAEDRPRFEAVQRELAAVRAKLADRKTAARVPFAWWLARAKAAEVAGRVPTDKLQLHGKLTEGEGRTVAFAVDGKESKVTLPDGFAWTPGKFGGKAYLVQQGASPTFPTVGDFDTKDGFTVSAWVKVTRRGTTGALAARMDTPANGHRGWDLWMEADKIGMHVIHKFPDDALKVVSRTPLKPNQWVHVCVTYDGSAKPDGIKVYLDGVPQPTDTQTNTLKSTVRTKVPFKVGQREGEQRVQNVGLADLRVYARTLSGPDAERLAKTPQVADVLAKPADKRTAKEKDELYDWYLAAFDRPYLALNADESKLEQEEAAIRGRGTIAHVAAEKPSMPEAYVLYRGEYDRRKDKVGPDTPKAMPPFPADLPRNRLGLAKWLLRKDHPLTARVTVNRFWQEVFGTGLVRTAGDFGVTGEPPSHPELLDWLAEEFEDHWDVKRFFKLLVTSAAYRQAAVTTKEKLEKDGANRLLSRGPRFRMDAEMVRDYALAASGLLVRKLGGPSVKPYQPDGVWEAVAMIGSNTRDYKRDSGESLYRRSMYTFWKRSAPPASMEILNAPNRETCVVRRERTNTPLQALVTLNDVQFVEAARVLAEAALKSAPSDDARIGFVSARVLARPFRPEELTVVKETLADLRREFAAKPAEAKKLIAFGERKADPSLEASELAAWAMLCNQVLNLDEALNK